MNQDKHARQMERFFAAMAATFFLFTFAGFLFLAGCAPVQVKPGCENSWSADSRVDLAMNAGAIGLSEYLLQNPEHRSDAKKALKAAWTLVHEETVTLELLVSVLQKGISSKEVRARLGYIAILGTGRQSGVVLNACEREYLQGYFQRLLLMVG